MDLIAQHGTILALAFYWIFSAVVGGMPSPDQNSSKGYVWTHNALHLLAGNLNSAVSSRYPSITKGPQQPPPQP